jgi:hypothetical protein
LFSTRNGEQEKVMTESLVEMLQRGESRARGYNDYNRYAPPPGGVGHFRGADRQIDFSQVTVGEIRDNQRLSWNHPDKLHAVGRYQIIGPTLQNAMDEMGLQRTDRLTPELQDRILVENLMVSKRPNIHGYITGKEGVSLREAQVAMGNEWASVGHPDYSGRSRYAGNHATITLEQSAAVLTHARDQYRAAVADGKTPEEAWRTAAGLGQQPVRAHAQPQQSEPQNDTTQPRASEQRSPVLLKLGSEGLEVRSLQTALRGLGYTGTSGAPLGVDGDFGSNTDNAVRDFQRAHGLEPVDGKVGPDTRTALAQAAHWPLVSESTHPNHGLYAAIGAQLPSGTDPKVIASVALQAMENGITAEQKLERMAVSGTDAYLVGVIPGDRVKVDLTAPTPDLQTISDHMREQTQQQVQQQRSQSQAMSI